MSAQKQPGAWVNFIALIFVNFLWAAQYPAYKVASEHMESATLNFWTLLFAVSMLSPLWFLKPKPTSARTRLGWRVLRDFLLLGLLGIVPPSVMLSWGISHSSASNAAILSLTIPVLMIALGILMLGERLTPIRVISIALGLVGVLLISSEDMLHASFNRSLLLGNIVILIGGLGSAFYNTYSKKLLVHHSELKILIFSYAIGGSACAAISSLAESRPFYRITGYSSATWYAIAILGFLSWGIAMILWMWVLKRLDVGQISTSIYLLPIFGLVLSVLATHDRLRLPQIVGGIITLSGTVTLTFFDKASATNHSL